MEQCHKGKGKGNLYAWVSPDWKEKQFPKGARPSDKKLIKLSRQVYFVFQNGYLFGVNGRSIFIGTARMLDEVGFICLGQVEQD